VQKLWWCVLGIVNKDCFQLAFKRIRSQLEIYSEIPDLQLILLEPEAVPAAVFLSLIAQKNFRLGTASNGCAILWRF